MSQYYRKTTASTPAVATQFTADDATVAIPAANNLNVLARGTTDDRASNGVQTTADPNNGDNLYIELTNRVYGTASVTGAVTGDIITFDLGGDAAVYRFHLHVTGRDTSSGDGVGYSLFGSIRTDGAAATVIDTAFQDADEDASLGAAQMAFVASGNNMVLRATGVTDGMDDRTISYAAYGYYIVV